MEEMRVITLNQNAVIQFFDSFRFSESLFQSCNTKTFKIFSDCRIKHTTIGGLSWKSLDRFLEEPLLFPLPLKWNLYRIDFLC